MAGCLSTCLESLYVIWMPSYVITQQGGLAGKNMNIFISIRVGGITQLLKFIFDIWRIGHTVLSQLPAEMETSNKLLRWRTHNNLTYCAFLHFCVHLLCQAWRVTEKDKLLAFKYYNASLSLLSIFDSSHFLSFLHSTSYYIFPSSTLRSQYDNKGHC